MLLVLEDGTVACRRRVSVQYAGAGGREPLLDGRGAARSLRTALRCASFAGTDVTSFRAASERLDALELPAAVAYGVSQALLAAAAHAARRTVAEPVADEYATAPPLPPVPLFAQSRRGPPRPASTG